MSSRMLIVCLIACLAPLHARADTLRDLDLRVEYGYYSGDVSVMRAAISELDAIRSPDADMLRLRALAHYRLAETSTLPSEVATSLAACIESAEAIEGDPEAEGLLLIAACSLELAKTEPLKSLLHERRMQRAMDAARSIAPANPRRALVACLYHEHQHGRDSGYLVAAQQTVMLFEARTASVPFDWGEAEAYVALAKGYRDTGELRLARDAVDAALLAAPGYVVALGLRQQLQAAVR